MINVVRASIATATPGVRRWLSAVSTALHEYFTRSLDSRVVASTQSFKYQYKCQYLSLKYQYQYQYQYPCLKYKCKHQYFGSKYQYQYKYLKMVLTYRSSTSTSTQYYNPARQHCIAVAAISVTDATKLSADLAFTRSARRTE